MNDKIDMHLHTDYSDGLLSPKQMVEYCFAKGIDEMAITDHDTVEGIFEAKSEPTSALDPELVGEVLQVSHRQTVCLSHMHEPELWQGIAVDRKSVV